MEQKRFSITLSAETYAWLKAKAESNHRSLSGETKTILEEAQKTEMERGKQEVQKAA